MAESKLKNLKRDSDKFCCSICLEEVRKPKYLPCYHTFCKSCIQTYISSTAACSGDNNPKTIQCPVCRKSIQAPSNDASSEEWAFSLPEDKLILCMFLESDRRKNEYCMFCQRNDKTVQAKHWCKTCMSTICDDCKFLHSYVPILEGHTIVHLSEVLDFKNNIEIEEPCLVHKGKYVEVFCQGHDQLCCSICFATKHRTCKTVESIEDVARENEESRCRITPMRFKDVLKKLDRLQEEYKHAIENLNTKKQDMFTSTETKVEEIKSLLDKAHNQWMKQFEQKHSDAVGNMEIASDEIKRFSTTVRAAKTTLQNVLEKGSPKQIFVTRHKLKHQILDHISRLRDLKIWNVVYDYTKPDAGFLRQILDDQNFQNVEVLEKTSTTIETISNFATELQYNNILFRREIMSQKDWMNVKFEKISKAELPSMVYYGLFVDDTKVLLSIENPPSLQIYDITDSNARCVHTFPCSTTPFGLCYSGDGMNQVYASFDTHVEQYLIEISNTCILALTKIKTIKLKTPMKAISLGSSLLFSRSDSIKMICTPGFSGKYRSSSFPVGDRPFISTSLRSDKFAVVEKEQLVDIDENNVESFVDYSCIVVVDENNKQVYKRYQQESDLLGLAFDLQDNILICLKNDKLRQRRLGGNESRDIDLPGIQESYNIILHPTGEKVLVLDLQCKFCVYSVV